MVDGSVGQRTPTNVSRKCWLAAASVVCGVLAAIAVTTTMADPNTGTGRVVVYQALKNESDGSDEPVHNGFEAPAAGARFGPPPPDDGLEGTVAIAEPIHACSPIAAAEGPMAIALIKRGGPDNTTCMFDTKVWHAQNAGFIGVIVFDNITEGSLAYMDSSSGQVQIDIPSVFISNDNGLMIADLVNRSASAVPPEMLVAQLYPDYVLVHAFLFTFVTIVAGTSIVFTLFLFYRRHMMLSRRNRRRVMNRHRVAQLPSRPYEEGDAGESCCICLDQYKGGDTLTVLPCNHGAQLSRVLCIFLVLICKNAHRFDCISPKGSVVLTFVPYHMRSLP
eukprot:m.206395 g.206395  ORF g.206395 m.206395 type:complete len:334 (-) comp18901_c0_seq2:13-1014(-)